METGCEDSGAVCPSERLSCAYEVQRTHRRLSPSTLRLKPATVTSYWPTLPNDTTQSQARSTSEPELTKLSG
jgi:hypothetical protein